MVGFLIWLLLLIFCWPLALIALIAYPLVWLILLPFRVLGIAVEGVLDLLRAIVLRCAVGPLNESSGRLRALTLCSRTRRVSNRAVRSAVPCRPHYCGRRYRAYWGVTRCHCSDRL